VSFIEMHVVIGVEPLSDRMVSHSLNDISINLRNATRPSCNKALAKINKGNSVIVGL